jgi:hypothetical protein
MVTIHLTLVITTMLAVLYADEQGFMWLLGKKETLSLRALEVVHAVTGIGLSLIILTGGLMFLDRSSYLLSNTFFIVKMTLVLALVINSFVIGRFANVASERPFAALTVKERRRLFISGGVSMACWVGAIICGLLL